MVAVGREGWPGRLERLLSQQTLCCLITMAGLDSKHWGLGPPANHMDWETGSKINDISPPAAQPTITNGDLSLLNRESALLCSAEFQ